MSNLQLAEGPESIADTAIAELGQLADRLTDAVAAADFIGYSDDEVLRMTTALEQLTRVVDPLAVTAAAEIDARSHRKHRWDNPAKTDLAAQKGCRNANELLQRLTQVSSATAARRLSLGEALRTKTALTGAPLPPVFPRVTAAFTAGQLGLEATRMILTALAPVARRASVESLGEAERVLVDAALGRSAQSPVPASVDELRQLAVACRALIDPDGAEPTEDEAFRRRGLRLGTEHDGVIPVRGDLVPEVAGQLQLLLDASLSPRTTPVTFRPTDNTAGLPPVPLDRRTPDQHRHDAFAMILGIAARAADTPSIGGAAPTVIVTVRQSDLDHNQGVGHIDGINVPVSLRSVRAIMCTGNTQHIRFTDTGAVLSLSTPERCFTANQRKAILARDGGCIIPGCNVRSAWVEIHHVTEHQHGGETTINNGCSVCWFHHRTLSPTGWSVRIHRGTPQVRAPNWLDPCHHWRDVTKSPTRLANQLDTT